MQMHEWGVVNESLLLFSYPALFPAVVQFKSLLLDQGWTIDVLLWFMQGLSSLAQHCPPIKSSFNSYSYTAAPLHYISSKPLRVRS